MPTITWFCREFKNSFPGIDIEMHIEMQEEEVQPSIKTAIYRLMQEALNNVTKHSRAELVYLSLRKTGDRIEFIIRDTGRGFDIAETLSVENSQKGFGLTSMRERVEISGGSFAIESVKGKGTTIMASWRAADEAL